MNDEDESVRHLVELGYVDPCEEAANQSARRRQLQAQLRQALALERQGSADLAATILEQIAVDDPDWSSPHQLLAEIYYRAGKLNQAQAQLDWLEQHGIDHPRMAVIRSAIALSRREMTTALYELEYARQAEPDLPGVHTLLGTVLRRLGQLDAAEDVLRQAVQQNPADARARDGLATILLRHGEYESAAEWALGALEQDMSLFSAHYHLGVALAQMNRPREAIAALETSTKVDPSRAAPYRWLCRIAIQQFSDASPSATYRDLARQTIRRRRGRSVR
jgi:Tfp pilus assembly protein PilF